MASGFDPAAPFGPYVPLEGGTVEFTLIVKAAPEVSKTYGEVVCTAGILDDGRLIRVYPVPWDDYRTGRFPKYSRVRATLEPSTEPARRPESHKLKGAMMPISDALQSGKGDTPWRERMELLGPAIEAAGVAGMKEKQKAHRSSLAIVKVVELVEFHIDAEPDAIIQQADYRLSPQRDLAGQAEMIGSRIDRLKHVFRYRWRCPGACCAEGKEPHNMTCEDWELFESYRSWRKNPRYDTNEKLAEALKTKFFDQMATKDLHFVLGTTSDPAYQQAPLIIGIVYPPAPKELRPKKAREISAAEVFQPPKAPDPARAAKRVQSKARKEGKALLDDFDGR